MKKHRKKLMLALLICCMAFICSIFIPTGNQKVYAVTKIQLNKKSVTLTKGNSTTLRLKGTIKKAKWTSNDKKIAIVKQNGKVIAKRVGKTKITAEVEKKKYTCTVSVVKPVSLNKKSITLIEGKSATLKLSGTKKKAKWISNDKTVATVSQKGTVIARKAGKAKIIATVGKKKYICNVKVICSESDSEIQVSSVRLSETSKTIYIGDSFILNATISPSNATNKMIEWSSDKEEVATVDNGKVTAISSGIAVITARAGNCSAKCRVRVKEIQVSSVRLSETSKTIYIGDSFILNATISPSNATNKMIEWSSDKEEVATVDNGKVTGISNGIAKITAKIGYETATCTVRVNEYEYTYGEEWKVEGQWGFKVNSVSSHYLCNSVSDKTGEQVVIIDYTYYQYGYYGNIVNYLWMSSDCIDVTDEKGIAASSYPCTHEKNAQRLYTIGSSCNASLAFVLENKSDTITLTVHKSPSNSAIDKWCTFTLPLIKETESEDKPKESYKENAEKLKSIIIEKGEVNADGYKYIVSAIANTENQQAKIIYIPENDVLSFYYFLHSDNLTSIANIDYGISSTEVVGVTMSSLWDVDSAYNYTAQSSIDISSYTRDTRLVFSVISGNQSLLDQDMCNSIIQLDMVAADTILMTHGLTLSDIGFSAYK